MVETKVSIRGMDKDWVKLILEAKNLGIAKEDIRKFFENKSVEKLR